MPQHSIFLGIIVFIYTGVAKKYVYIQEYRKTSAVRMGLIRLDGTSSASESASCYDVQSPGS